MAIVAVRNGLVKTIQDYGKWSASQISTCDFGIAENCASSVILAPGGGTSIDALTMMQANVRDKRVVWDMAGWVLVKDPGNPRAFLSSLWTAVDDIYESVNSDDTLAGTACAARITRVSRPSVDTFVEMGGMDFGVVEFNVQAEEF